MLVLPMSTCQNNMKLRVENVSKSYDGRKIIDDISMEIFDNEVVSLLGVSGVGKSTLFNIIAGMEIPDMGRVLCDDVDMTGKPGNVSYMLQKDLLIPHKTVIENVSLPLVIKGMKKGEAEALSREHLPSFSLDGMGEKYPHQLSGGMRQRVALLRTYMFSKELSLLDEPFSQLDYFTKRRMHEWYLSIMEKLKLTTLFITHDIDEAILLSDRIYIMGGSPGRIIKEMVIPEKRPRHNDFLLDENFLKYKKEILSIIG